MIIRSFLFVPGDSDKKLARAATSGADALILDLEDSVVPTQKAQARETVTAIIASRPAKSPALWVRINPLDEGGLADLAITVRPGLDGVVVPKIDGPADVARVLHALDVLELRDGLPPGSVRILPIATETAKAPFNLGRFADAALPRVYGLTWGAEDLSTALGASTNRDGSGDYAFTYRMVRSLTLLGAKAAGVQPVESVWTDFRDLAGFQADCAQSAREGFTGRMAIHPDQVAAINRSYAPSDADVAHARRVLDAFAAAPGAGTVALDGAMIDIPHLKQAELVLARHEASARTAALQTA